MAYKLKINPEKKELEVSFNFDKTFTYASSIFSAILLLSVMFFINLDTTAEFFAVISLTIILGNISLSDWLEWKKIAIKRSLF